VGDEGKFVMSIWTCPKCRDAERMRHGYRITEERSVNVWARVDSRLAADRSLAWKRPLLDNKRSRV
jgi:hypothetical protein